jgi:hypothetical protein
MELTPASSSKCARFKAGTIFEALLSSVCRGATIINQSVDTCMCFRSTGYGAEILPQTGTGAAFT